MNLLKRLSAVLLALLLCGVHPVEAYRFAIYSDCRAPFADWGKPFPYNLFNADVLDFITRSVVALSPQPDFVIVAGDLINGTIPNVAPDPLTNLDYWKQFMEARLDGVPLYVAVGNSDLYGHGWPTLLTAQVAFAQTFSNLPDNGPSTPVDFRHLVYSFEHGEGEEKTLFVVLDSFGIYNDGTHAEVHCDNDYDPADYGLEQINWFSAQAQASTAHHKFVITHGPAISVEGWPVQRNVKKVLDVALQNSFDTFFCAHEHLFYRWNITQATYPTSNVSIIQNLTGTSGAVPDSSSAVWMNPGGRIYFGYNFVVVDVTANSITESAYSVTSDGAGGYTTQLIDTTILLK